MSEPLLRGLMQLFAIIAKLDGVRTEERKVVEKFLTQQLNKEAINKYLVLFDEYASRQAKAKIELNIEADTYGERASVRDSSKMLLICNQINHELAQEQKVVVLVRLFELIVADGIITEQEAEFVKTVGEVFNIDHSELESIERFVCFPDSQKIDLSNLLAINGSAVDKSYLRKHLFVDGFVGQLIILRVPSVDSYLIRYKGGNEYLLNGSGLIDHQIYSLPSGSTIRGHKIKTIYFSDIEDSFQVLDAKATISFEVKRMSYRFPNGQTGLVDVSISEKSGHMIGLMGGSGAGKSTLMEVLNGNLSPFSGEVLINGLNIHQHKKKIEGIIGYVPQDDLLIEQLSVYDNLYYAAQLSFGNYSTEQIQELVNKTLQELGLAEISHLRIGSSIDKSISGGQRKRVNIGLELLRAPSVLFIDEPTSGLSSRDSENIMDLLKELSTRGKLVFVVIHQPSSDIFKMFDRLYILDKGGYPVYYGNPVDAVIYFKQIINQVNSNSAECAECGNVNSEQIFDIIETRVVNEFGRFTDQRKIAPEEWHRHFKEKTVLPISTLVSAIPNNPVQRASRAKQLFIYLKRDIQSKLGNLQYLLLILLTPPLLAVLLSYVCKHYVGEYVFRNNENVPVFIFMSIIVALFMGMIISAEEIYRDRRILKRERFLHLSWNSYIGAKLMALLMVSALQSAIFVWISHSILEVEGMLGTYWLILFLSAAFANLLGLNISSAFNSAVTIYILIPILLIPQLILGGIVITFDKINPRLNPSGGVPLMAEVMASRWAFEALALAQFRDNEFEKPYFELNKTMAEAEYRRTYLIPTLESKLRALEQVGQEEEKHQLWQLISTALKEEQAFSNIVFEANFPKGLPSSKQVESLRAHLEDLRKAYVRQFNRANREKDLLVAEQSTNHLDEYISRRNKYTNAILTNFLTNTRSEERIVILNNKILQRIYPVYQTPSAHQFKAHFFAPVKFVFGQAIDTFWADIGVLVLMCLLLYLLLYFKIAHHLVNLWQYRLDIISKLKQ